MTFSKSQPSAGKSLTWKWCAIAHSLICMFHMTYFWSVVKKRWCLLAEANTFWIVGRSVVGESSNASKFEVVSKFLKNLHNLTVPEVGYFYWQIEFSYPRNTTHSRLRSVCNELNATDVSSCSTQPPITLTLQTICITKCIFFDTNTLPRISDRPIRVFFRGKRLKPMPLRGVTKIF